jgi:ATP/maltotriose-dependent transcriptional regulator MalT
VITEEKLVMANTTAFLTNPEKLRFDAEGLLEPVTRGRFDDASREPSPVHNRAPLDRHQLAMRITIRLVAIMASENENPMAWHELGRALDYLQHSIQANDPTSGNMARGREPLRQPNEVDEVPEQQQSGSINDALSRREISIVARIGQGRSNKEIARQLGIAPETVKTHIKRIFSKLGVERRAQAVCRAHALGLVSQGAPPL